MPGEKKALEDFNSLEEETALYYRMSILKTVIPGCHCERSEARPGIFLSDNFESDVYFLIYSLTKKFVLIRVIRGETNHANTSAYSGFLLKTELANVHNGTILIPFVLAYSTAV